MKRGFTIVEISVVIVVIALILAFAITAYETQQRRSLDAQARGLAAAVQAAAERYYTKNNEYVLASVLYGGTPVSTTPPASYDSTVQNFNIPLSNLSTDHIKFALCNSNSCSTLTNGFVYYATRSDTTTTTASSIVVGSCTYTFPTNETGGLSYMILFYSYSQSKWLVARSSNGNVTTSNTTTCPFISL